MKFYRCAPILLLVIIVCHGHPTSEDEEPQDSNKTAQQCPEDNRISVMEERLDVQQKQLAALIEKQTDYMTAYTRWGRTKCEDPATVVYKGYAAGSQYQERGGPSSYVCLPDNPQWSRFEDGKGHNGNLHGLEYLTDNVNSLFLTDNNKGESMYLHDMPCVHCATSGRSVTHTFLATTRCPDNWFFEYTGFLMSQFNDHVAAAGPICVDEAPEGREGGAEGEQAAYAYFVAAKCRALPCPPYVDGRQLACTVCSR